MARVDLAAVLQREILAVIAKHFLIDRDKVTVKLDPRPAGLHPGDRHRNAAGGRGAEPPSAQSDRDNCS